MLSDPAGCLGFFRIPLRTDVCSCRVSSILSLSDFSGSEASPLVVSGYGTARLNSLHFSASDESEVIVVFSHVEFSCGEFLAV